MAFKRANKSGQAAMEFLMTYGWALLVLLVSLGSLTFYFGYDSSFVSETCLFGPGLGCSDILVNEGSISLKIRNSLGKDMTSFSVSSDNCDPVVSVPMENGEEKIIIITGCTFSAGDVISESINVSYSFSNSDLIHVRDAILVAVVQGGTSSDQNFISGPGDLGTVPFAINWPTSPTITNTYYVINDQEYASVKGNPNSKVIVRGNLGDISIEQDDFEVIIDSGFGVQEIFISQGLKRISIKGPGTVKNIKFALPEIFTPYQSNEAWCIEDVIIDRIIIPNSGSKYSFDLPCVRRVAIINNEATGDKYAVWSGNNPDFQNRDLIIARNKFYGGEGCPVAGNCESTIRLVDHTRATVVGNILHNPYKHTLRIHGASDTNIAKDNLFLGRGFMTNGLGSDNLQNLYFNKNVFYHLDNSLFQIDNPQTVEYVQARDNVAYSDVFSQFYNFNPEAGWDMGNNAMHSGEDLPMPYWLPIS